MNIADLHYVAQAASHYGSEPPSSGKGGPMTAQGTAGQTTTGQGTSGQSSAAQGTSGQGTSGQGTSGQSSAGQSSAGRANQKLRTRTAIVQAAAGLSRTGRELTMPEIAS